jgi:hypothetical protein
MFKWSLLFPPLACWVTVGVHTMFYVSWCKSMALRSSHQQQHISALLTKLNLFAKFPLVGRGSAILNFHSSVNFCNNNAPSIRKVDYRFLICFDAFYQSIIHIQRAIYRLHLWLQLRILAPLAKTGVGRQADKSFKDNVEKWHLLLVQKTYPRFGKVDLSLTMFLT